MDTNSIGSTGFHHVAINARAFDRSLTFYRDRLGFRVRRPWTFGAENLRGVMLDTGDGACMEIFEDPAHEAPRGNILHFALRVTDVAAAHRTALDAGAKEKVAPKEITIPSDPPLDATISFVFGPDGEEIEFFQER